ncbi:MAG: transposase domain-containing protein [Deltaproteobacteria bacterium]|jgi:hypothetical protein|nr:transposase domain-containing protein [Deltaproteobacteria bacterium]
MAADLSHLFSLGYFQKVVPRRLIAQVLEETGRESKRIRLMPAAEVVYLTMFMAINRDPNLGEVVGVFNDSMKKLGARGQNRPGPNPAGISQARGRLGFEPLRLIADKVLRPLASQDFGEAFYGGMRLWSIDESFFDTPDEAKNAEYFGYEITPEGRGAFPQVRVMSLVETLTRTVTAAELGPLETEAKTLVGALLGRNLLTATDLLVSDWNRADKGLWSKIMSNGAGVVLGGESDLNIEVLERLSDGSFIALNYDLLDREGAPGRVRLIGFGAQSPGPAGGGGKTVFQKGALVTSLLNHKLCPADELMALYREKKTIDDLFGEFKNAPKGASTVLRSKTPELIYQELWGLLLVHFALRELAFGGP